MWSLLHRSAIAVACVLWSKWSNTGLWVCRCLMFDVWAGPLFSLSGLSQSGCVIRRDIPRASGSTNPSHDDSNNIKWFGFQVQFLGLESIPWQSLFWRRQPWRSSSSPELNLERECLVRLDQLQWSNTWFPLFFLIEMMCVISKEASPPLALSLLLQPDGYGRLDSLESTWFAPDYETQLHGILLLTYP